jgi:hypothetical protein
MAVANSVKVLFPGFGAPTEYVLLPAVALAHGGAANAFTFTGFNNPIRTFRLRLKTVVPVIAATTITAIKITGTDGTTTVTFYQDAIARTAAENEDLLFEGISDLFLTTITATVTSGAAGGADTTMDGELAGNN